MTSYSMIAGILLGQATNGELAVHLAENAAEHHAGRLALAEERDLDVDRLVELDLDEVGVKQARG